MVTLTRARAINKPSSKEHATNLGADATTNSIILAKQSLQAGGYPARQETLHQGSLVQTLNGVASTAHGSRLIKVSLFQY